MLDLLLVLGLLLSPASQLRPMGAAVGPGELLLVMWLAAMFARETARLGPPLTPALSCLLIFWALFAATQCIGTLTGFAIGDVHDPKLFLHDVMAYPLLAAVSCFAVVDPGADTRLHRVAWLLATLGAALLALQLAHGWELFAIPAADPWYWDRFRGWSENPNQLALLCVMLAFLSTHLADRSRGTARLVAASCAGIAIYVGRLTKSDTFGLVLVMAVPLFFALKLRAWLRSSERKLTARSALAWLVVLTVPLALLAALPMIYATGGPIEGLIRSISKDNGEGTQEEAQLRLYSWREAIDRGLESGMLGLGPGPHLNIPPTLVAARQSEDGPKHLGHPEVNNTPNFEAHDTMLDLFTQGGLLAVLCFTGLAATTLFVTFRARLDGLTTLICGLGVFSIFHLIVRHPLFWFVMAYCLVAASASREAAPTRKRS